MALSAESAQIIALQALEHLAEDEDLLAQFLVQTGVSVEDLQMRAGDPEFCGFVLDFLFSDEAAATAFAISAKLSPDQLKQVRYALPAAAPEWG